tara:strand:- start:297 stop:500 length:204 start_codon:yes stop_codon:yes gene_type:complete
MNCTTGAKQMINQRRTSNKTLRKGFTPIFAENASEIPAWSKLLGEHFITGHKQTGWKCNSTGKITKK